MKRKVVMISLIAFVLSILLTACGTSSTPEPTNISPVPTTVPATLEPTDEPIPESISVIDDLGAEIILETPAQSIISISPNLTEILFGVGAGDRLIGRDSNSQYPEAALEAVV